MWSRRSGLEDKADWSIKHGWLENHLPIEDFIGKSPTDGPFSIAMFDYHRVAGKINGGTRRKLEISGLMLALAVSISWHSHESGTPDANFGVIRRFVGLVFFAPKEVVRLLSLPCFS